MLFVPELAEAVVAVFPPYLVELLLPEVLRVPLNLEQTILVGGLFKASKGGTLSTPWLCWTVENEGVIGFMPTPMSGGYKD